MTTPWKRAIQVLATAVVLSVVSLTLFRLSRKPPPVTVPDPAPVEEVSKWAVEYDDLTLGQVQGVAYCNWAAERVRVKLRNPATGELHAVEAKGFPDIFFSNKGTRALHLVLHGRSPFKEIIAGPKASGVQGISAGESETGKFVHSGDPSEAQVSKTGVADRDRVELELLEDSYGTLSGRWSYVANPLTERDTEGYGRVGVFSFLEDDAVDAENGAAKKRGGFLGKQSGSETWTPLPAQIYDVEVLEEQAAFDQGGPVYRHARDTKNPNQDNSRTLFVFGRDLPLDEGAPLTFLQANDNGISYEVVAVAGTKGLKDEDTKRFEIGWQKATKGMDAKEAGDFRKLDAVMVKATLTAKADAGPKSFRWGGGKGYWDLQYGDNTADVRFVRILNDKESEQVTQLALPEAIVVEVNSLSGLDASEIPVRLGSNGPIAAPDGLVASKVPGSPYLYRTPPIVFSAAGESADAAPPNTIRVSVRKGSRVFAGVDRTKTYFLRASMAAALASEPTSLWLNGLKRAASCNNLQTKDWSALPRQPAQTFIGSGQSVDISYGDHAAMLILRDVFLQAMRAQIEELKAADSDDGLLDAWHLSMAQPVLKVPDFPLAAITVKDRDGAEIPFARTFSWEYAIKTFQPYNTSDGLENWRQWRRSADREALWGYRKAVQESLAASEKIDDCNWQELLKLTGSGFGQISSRLEPLLMRRQPDEKLLVRDKTARIYVRNLDTLAERVQSIEALKSARNKLIMLGVSGVVAVPAVIGGGIGTMASLVGGFAIFGAESSYQIYETYQQHEEVRFEFGASAQLGFDRFFEAQSRLTPWWQTGVSIFGQAVLQGIGLKVAMPDVKKGLSIWRGGRIFRSVESRGLASVRALSPREEHDLAMFLFDAQERFGSNLAVSARSRYAARVFDELGQESAGVAKPKLAKSLEEDLAADAANAADEFKASQAPANDPLRHAKTELSESALFQQARTVATPSVLLERAVSQKVVFHNGLPYPGVPWKVTVDGVEHTVELGEILGQGCFFTTYTLRKIPEGLAVDPALGTDLVIKIFNKGSDVLKTANESFLPGISENVIQRMTSAQNLLKSKGIRQLEFQGFEDAGFVLQKRVDKGKFQFFDGDKLRAIKWADRDKIFAKDMRRAVAELYKKFSDNGLVWLDGHMNNVYFELTDKGWAAGVLDQDMITKFESVEDGVYGHFFQMTCKNPMKPVYSTGVAGDLKYSTAESLMQKMLEAKAWMKFDMRTKTYDQILLDPNEVKEVFKDLPYVAPPAVKTSRAGSHPADVVGALRVRAKFSDSENVGFHAPLFWSRKILPRLRKWLGHEPETAFWSPRWQACPV